MRSSAILFGALLLAVAASAHVGQAEPATGLFSNVCLEPETDDYGGHEVWLRLRNGATIVGFKECAGGCWEQPTKDVVVSPGRVEFSAVDQDFDASGRLVNAETHRYVARIAGRRLVLESPDQKGFASEVLIRRRDYPASDPRATSASGGAGMVDWPAPTHRCGR